MSAIPFAVRQSRFQRITYLVSLLKDNTTLAVSDNSPVNLSILELLNADFTGESTVGLVEDVLGGNANLGVGSLAGMEEVEGRGGDDDFDGGVKLGLIEVFNDGGDGVSDTVPIISPRKLVTVRLRAGMKLRGGLRGIGLGLIHLEVTTDEELARHFG
jgi:hypothetical protein